MDRWDEFSERLRDVETREVHFAGSGDPNAVVSAAMGAQYWDHINDDLWVNDDGASSWKLVGGAGGITGGGLATQVAYFTAPNVIAGDAGMTYVAGTDTLTVGNVIVATGGNVLPADAAGQDLGDATHRWDAFASYVDLPDGGWIGIGPAAERIEFYTAGCVAVMGAKFGVGTATPAYVADFGSPVVGGRDIGWGTATNTRYATIGSMRSSAGLFLGRGVVSNAGVANRLDYSTTVAVNKLVIALYSTGIVFATKAAAVEVVGNQFDWVATYARMIIGNSGNVGINKISPNRRQHTREESASTNVIIPIARFEAEVSGGVGAAGHGAGAEFYGESSTTTNQAMGLIAARWSVATHASRRSRLEFRTWYIGNEVLVGVVEAPGAAGVDGNARGTGAVDWQGFRINATEVASGDYAALGGGFFNTVSGNTATVPGGYSCIASGEDSFATGWDAHATHAHSFVLSATGAQTVSWGANTWTARCHGGARFYSAAGVGTGVQLTAGGNAWAGISDRNVKENFRPVEGILGKIALLPIYDYNLKAQSEDVRHIGPVSQDFNEIFGFTEAPLRINMLDIAGVGLAGVQALHAEVVVLRERVQGLEARSVD